MSLPLIATTRAATLLSVCGAVLAPVSATYATPSIGAPPYSITAVAPFSQQYRFGLGLNNKGHVTGQTTGAQAFLYDGSLRVLGKPAGATFSVGQGISDNDIVAATAQQGTVRNAYAVSYTSGHAVWSRLAGLPGYEESEAESILPDGSAITGELCATNDPACSHLGEHSQAVVWWRSGKKWSGAAVLATGVAPHVSHVSGIARAGAITVVSGEIVPRGGNTTSRAALWLLPGHRSFQLTGAGSYLATRADAIAHGHGNTFYVAGSIARPDSGATYGKPVMWTVACTATACRQTNLQVITSLGETFTVNSQGIVTGYERVGGDPGSDFVWRGGKETLVDLAGHTINSSGQMTTWRIHPPGTHHLQVVLLTPTS